MQRFLILNGPNLDQLGKRDPHHYGHLSWPEMQALIEQKVAGLNVSLSFFQTASEGELIAQVHALKACQFNGLVINAGAYSHTSIALKDALSSCPLPVVEVHLSNIYAREPYRQHSWLSAEVLGVIAGMGWRGYAMACEQLAAHIQGDQNGYPKD